jgi:hypothetical protein
MNDPVDPGPSSERDPVLDSAGARLRAASKGISPVAVEASVLRRRSRRLGLVAGGALAVSALLAGTLVVQASDGGDASEHVGPAAADLDDEGADLLASLDPEPVDPTTVRLVSTVSTFPDCDALVADLRRVGAAHVGSRGFGGFGGLSPYSGLLEQAGRVNQTADESAVAAPSATGTGGETLGTNVQVAGVDELDHVKAVGDLIFDLDGRGNLRVTDASDLRVLSTLDVTPGSDDEAERQVLVSDLLVDGDRVVVFGSEVEVSDPVDGDPSATRAATSYLTLTFVDARDPAVPSITDRVRVEGALVSARLVDGEVRLVATSHMADLGFVMPTTPSSVAKALAQNRASVAASSVADWIPDWERAGAAPEPLVPCDRVHVPDTFSGVAMTSMVTFPLGSGRFEPAGTSILAPGATLYAGLDRVAISSEVWVDPVDREQLSFEDWQTAIHEFGFAAGAPPAYQGSGIVDLAVVTTEGTPWKQDPQVAVDLTVLTPDGAGRLAETAQVEDLAGGDGAVTAVRFLEGRVLVSTGAFGRTVHVIDVTDPAQPRRAGAVPMPGDIGYFHPLPDGRALVVGSRHDEVGTGDDRTTRPWVQVHLIDVQDADAPQVLATWERPWSADSVGVDHHAFTWWPERQLAMWGVQDVRWERGREPGPHHAVVLSADGGLGEVAAPVANKPAEAPAPCPTVEVTDPDVRQMVGPGGVVLRCEDPGTEHVDWPRYSCSRVDDAVIGWYVPEDQRDAAFFHCAPAPHPSVARVLVVSARPILLTDQTLEALDPTTFASTALAYHPSTPDFGLFGR